MGALHRLQGVLVGLGGGDAASETPPVGPVAHHVRAHVAGVGEPVDVADLIAVVGRDGYLDDALLEPGQRQDDLGVEVEAVGQGLEVDVGQRVDPVGAVAAVPLAEPEPGQAVLERGQDAVADVLVPRHATAQSRTAFEHAGAEDRVGHARAKWLDDVLDALRGILPVAVEQHHDVEAVLDRPRVAGLLVAAVAEVRLVADDGERQRGVAREGQPDVVGVVGARIVADQHVLEGRGEGGGEPRQGAGQGVAGVVGHDEHADAWRVVEHWCRGRHRQVLPSGKGCYSQVRFRGQAAV